MERIGQPGTSLLYRDLEFAFDTLYVGVTPAQRVNTLKNWATTLNNSTGASPVAIDAQSDLQATYNYFRREGANWNTTNARDSTALRVGWAFPDESVSDGVPLNQYTNLDRAHVDVYLVHPSNPLRGTFDGRYPSIALAADEDVSSFRALNDTRHFNSLLVVGPTPPLIVDESGTGWTRPGTVFQTNFNHEFTHSLPSDHATGVFDELLSAGAEAVGGIFGPPRFEFPYTQQFLQVYQERTAFMAYLAYGFLNADSNRTLAGTQDDLPKRWRGLQTASNSPGWGLGGLRDALSDANCQTCQAASYFHPGGVSMPVEQRLSTLIHNWRVAMFVNSPTHAERQFGFPAWSGFSPNASVAAWRSFDGIPSDDVVALPSIVNVGAAQLSQELTLKDSRTLRGGSEPLSLHLFGANYWVVRAASDAQSTNRDLAMRVVPMGFIRGNTNTAGGRLVVSAVAYNHVDTTATDDTFLWRHPEWASYVTPVQWAEVDSVSGEIEVVVPNFGLTHKAVMLVLTLADGRFQTFGGTAAPLDLPVMPYRVDLSLRPAGSSLPVTEFHAVAGRADGGATWSPDGAQLAFHSVITTTSAKSQIYRKPRAGGAVTRISVQDSLDLFFPDWSARGDLIAYEGQTTPTSSNIWLTGAYAGPPTQLTNLAGCAAYPAFQPDGRGLVYLQWNGSAWSLRWIAINGTGDRHVATIGNLGTAGCRPRWSADGTKVFMVINSLGDRVAWVPITGGSWSVLQSDPTTCLSVDLHPGSGRLAATPKTPLPNFASALGSGGPDIVGPRLAFVDTSATTPDVLFRFNVYDRTVATPRYSPDGTSIAFQAHLAGQDDDIYVAQVTANHAPALSNINDEAFEACVPFELQLAASDADGDVVHYEVFQKPPGVTLSASNILRWTRPVAGDYFVIIRGIDARGAVDKRAVWWHVFDGGSCGTSLLAGGSGGSSGFAVRTATASTIRPVRGPASTFAGNSLLDGVAPDVWVERCERMPATAMDSLGNRALTIANVGGATAELDLAQVLSISSPPGASVFGVGDDIAIARMVRPTAVTSAESTDLTASLASGTAPAMVFARGSTLMCDFADAALLDGIVLQCSRGGATADSGAGGISVQVRDSLAWTTVSRIHPRLMSDQLGAATPGSRSVRLLFESETIVAGVQGYFEDATDVAATRVDTLSLLRTANSDTLAELTAPDSQSLTLSPGQSIATRVAAPAGRPGLATAEFLIVRARLKEVPATELARLQHLAPGQAAATSSFELGIPRPNPFTSRVTMGVKAPRSARVGVDVFDTQGRRVRRLMNEQREAGEFVIEWDGLDDRRSPARPGVYLVRMRVGTFVANRRITLLHN